MERKRVNLFIDSNTQEYIATMTARLGMTKGEVVDWMAERLMKECIDGTKNECKRVCGLESR